MTVLDVIEKPPATNMYDKLKEILIERHSLSEEKRLEGLLSSNEMGDRKPSEFFRALENLAGPSTQFSKDLILRLWTRRLPGHVNVALLASGKTEVTDLTTMADKIWEATNNGQISAIAQTQPVCAPSTFASSSDISQLCSAVAEMVTQFRDMRQELNEMRSIVPTRNPREYSRQRSLSRNRFRNRSQSNGRRDKPYCYYHFKFGDNARRCTSPCTYKNKDNQEKNM